MVGILLKTLMQKLDLSGFIIVFSFLWDNLIFGHFIKEMLSKTNWIQVRAVSIIKWLTTYFVVSYDFILRILIGLGEQNFPFCLFIYFTNVKVYRKSYLKYWVCRSYVVALSLFRWAQSKPCVKRRLSKRPKIIFKTDYCLKQVKSIADSAIFSTFINLPVVIKTFVSSILSGRFTLYILLYNKCFIRDFSLTWEYIHYM